MVVRFKVESYVVEGEPRSGRIPDRAWLMPRYIGTLVSKGPLTSRLKVLHPAQIMSTAAHSSTKPNSV